jgi:hypothetical protein
MELKGILGRMDSDNIFIGLEPVPGLPEVAYNLKQF